jgi:hypothetical protein
MTLERVERYVIEQSAHGTVLRMRQVRRALGVAFLSLAVLFVTWWFGPYGPRPALDWALSNSFYWLWSGFFFARLHSGTAWRLIPRGLDL